MTDYQYLITVEELGQYLDEPGWRIMDCRHDLMQSAKGHEEYRHAHIPGAQHANLDKDLAAPVSEASGRHPLPTPNEFAARLGAWGIGNDTQVVAYDDSSGAVAARLWWMLKWLGHDKVAVLDGGYAAWQEAGRPVTDEPGRIAPARFEPSADPGMLVSTEELQTLMDSGSAPVLVDARAAGRFAGRCEPIDSVAGHVPGAVNHPYSEAIDERGRWRRTEELKKGWARTLGKGTDRPWIAMCGSGVTACHLALSAALAGYRRPRIYVGSWSEWIRDPGRPVAIGAD